MKIIYVPRQFESALKAAGLHGKDLLSIQKLSNILSPEDVAFYIYVNTYLHKVVPAAIASSFTPHQFDLSANATGGTSRLETSATYQQEVSRILDSYKVNQNAPAVDTDAMRLTCDPLTEDTVRFTHVLLDKDEMSDLTLEGARRLYVRVCQLLYTFVGLVPLARLPVFGHYLKVIQHDHA